MFFILYCFSVTSDYFPYIGLIRVFLIAGQITTEESIFIYNVKCPTKTNDDDDVLDQASAGFTGFVVMLAKERRLVN